MFQWAKCRLGFHRAPGSYFRWFKGDLEIGNCPECRKYVGRRKRGERWRASIEAMPTLLTDKPTVFR